MVIKKNMSHSGKSELVPKCGAFASIDYLFLLRRKSWHGSETWCETAHFMLPVSHFLPDLIGAQHKARTGRKRADVRDDATKMESGGYLCYSLLLYNFIY